MAYAKAPNIALDSNYIGDQQSGLDEAFRGDYLAGTNLIYKGFARPGTDEGDLAWQIAKLTYDGNNNVTSIKWPNAIAGVANAAGYGSNDYIFSWTNRATYTYS